MIIIGILFCIIAAGFFAGLETGLLSSNHMSLHLKAEKGIISARAAYFLVSKPEKLLSTTLIGTNIAIISATVLFKSLFAEIGVADWISWIFSLPLSLVILIFSEVIPKIFFRQYADTITIKLAPVLVCFYFLFLPVTFILNNIVFFVLIIFNGKKYKRGPKSRADLKLLISLISREAGIPLQGRNIFNDIFDFNHTLAREVMIPFHKIPVCGLESTLDALIALYMKTKCQFIAIFTERADHIVGYIDIHDLLIKDAKNITEVMKKVIYYPDNKKIPDLLIELNRKKLPIVFLSDEYGDVSGMITPNEIASEIIGHIPGNRSKRNKEITIIENEDYYVVHGTADLEDINNLIGLTFEKGPYDTIGGYISYKLGIIPLPGTIFDEKDVSFKVLEQDERHITKVEIRRKTESELEKKIK